MQLKILSLQFESFELLEGPFDVKIDMKKEFFIKIIDFLTDVDISKRTCKGNGNSKNNLVEY